jgi:hypothetical protein
LAFSSIGAATAMITAFDYLAVACFAGLVVAFFKWTDRSPRTLSRLLLSSIAFAMANHLGNVGFHLFALVLIAAGTGYAMLVLKGKA